MEDTRPQHSADWHARRAEDLADRARSVPMSGWWKRRQRRDMLAAAQIHATLGAVAMPTGRTLERLALAEGEAQAAAARADDLAAQLAEVEERLQGFGQDLTINRSTAEAVDALMRHVFNDEPLDAPTCRVCADNPEPGSYCADCGRQG